MDQENSWIRTACLIVKKETSVQFTDFNGGKSQLISLLISPRHFGAKYVDMHTDYTGQGVDQLQQVIDTIKKDPNNRRIIMSAWNPAGFLSISPTN